MEKHPNKDNITFFSVQTILSTTGNIYFFFFFLKEKITASQINLTTFH